MREKKENKKQSRWDHKDFQNIVLLLTIVIMCFIIVFIHQPRYEENIVTTLKNGIAIGKLMETMEYRYELLGDDIALSELEELTTEIYDEENLNAVEIIGKINKIKEESDQRYNIE